MRYLITLIALLLLFGCQKQTDLEYYDSGRLKSIITTVKDSIYEGVVVEFHEDGKVSRVAHCDLQANCKVFAYSNDGTEVQTGNLVNGKKEGLWKIRLNGFEIVRSNFKEGKLIDEVTLTKKGDTITTVNRGKAIFRYIRGGVKRIICSSDSSVYGKIELDSMGNVTLVEGNLPCLTKEDSMKIKFSNPKP